VILEIAGLVLLLLVAVALIAPMLRSSSRQVAQKQWPRVQAEVLARRVRIEGDTGFPEYSVRYAIDGRLYEEYAGSAGTVGHTHYLNPRIKQAVDAKMGRTPIGSQIQVKVNPSDHRQVYLVERELPARALAYAVAAIFLLFFLLFVALAFDFI
jgi:hypothetical protein